VTRFAAGRFLFFGTSFVILSLLVETPECRVPALGGSEHGFSPLSGAGRLFINGRHSRIGKGILAEEGRRVIGGFPAGVRKCWRPTITWLTS
jgi:hypothetical protein